jgi:hypothetical protein
MKKFATFATLVTATGISLPAAADCSGDIRQLRTRLIEVREEPRRQEAQRLLDKAEKDDKAGRARQCADAVSRASILLKPR